MSTPRVSWLGSPNFHGGRLRPVRLIVIHTMESGEDNNTAENVASYFGKRSTNASAHYNVDNNSIVQGVHDYDTAWAAPGANSDGIQFEHAGRAGQGVGGWADAYSQDMLRLSARMTADVARRYSIPVRRLSTSQLASGQRGFIGHVDASRAYRLSDHTDPGDTFPWAFYFSLVGAELRGSTVPPAATLPGRQLELGCVGNDVKRMQTALMNSPVNNSYIRNHGGADGSFGQGTRTGVMQCQKAVGGIDVDGLVGPASRKAWSTKWHVTF